jgi:hypothetical protein
MGGRVRYRREIDVHSKKEHFSDTIWSASEVIGDVEERMAGMNCHLGIISHKPFALYKSRSYSADPPERHAF